MTWIFIALAIGWWGFAFGRLWDLTRIRSIDDPQPEAGPERPRVSVVVPARNEEARIEQTVRRLLAQREIDLQLIVVDDRSTDATSTILQRIADDDPRLQLLRIDELPEGWLGKSHACARGAELADGEWILFTDADTWQAEDLLSRAVAAATRDEADMLCLFPNQQVPGIFGRASILCFSLGFVAFAARANNDRRFPVGIGAFNLVKRSSYDRCGGYEALRLEVIDDMKLGLLILRSGGRIRCYGAPRSLEIDWARSSAGLVRALEKNFFAMLHYNFLLAALVTIFIVGSWALAWAGALYGGFAGWFAFSGVIASLIPAIPLARNSGWSITSALAVPIMHPVIAVTLARSAWLTWRQDGVRWRETHYSLETLRRHQVRLY